MRLIILFILLNINALSQNSAKVNILNANALEVETVSNEILKKLKGDVSLEHKSTKMFCDSAIIHENNNVEAFNDISIIRPNGVKIFGDRLNYLSEARLIIITGDVVLKDKKANLFTNEIIYDLNTEEGQYSTGGKVINDSTIITSTSGKYFSTLSTVLFKENVIVTNPKFDMTTDTLMYNTKNDIFYFYSRTHITNDSGDIFCNNGSFYQKQNQFEFGQNTLIQNSESIIISDSIFYDKNLELSRILKTFEFHDTINKMHVFGDSAIYYDQSKNIICYNRPLVVYEQDTSDFMFMRANTITSVKKLDNREVFGVGRVRMYNDTYQAICDSMYYSSKDSVITLNSHPFAWQEDAQLSGDVIVFRMKNKKLDSLQLYGNAKIVENEIMEHYNQIFADTILIKMNKIKGIDNLFGYNNSKSIYYAKEEGKEGYIGINNSESKKLKSIFVDGKITRIVFLEQPKVIFYPVDKINNSNNRLDGFIWNIDKRPKNQDDL